MRVVKEIGPAIPTEYKGVEFRSKSEAIFCRALELRGYTFWQYEPKKWEMPDGWKPDFWALAQDDDHYIFSLIIEYKPAMVTESYLERLAERFAELKLMIYGSLPVLACGNSFNPERRTFVLRDGIWEETETAIKLFKHIEEAARYRFDLA